jgi:dUTP pyrophosphatase
MTSIQHQSHMKMDTSPINYNAFPAFQGSCDANIWSAPTMSVSTGDNASCSETGSDSLSRLRNTFDPILNVRSQEKIPLLRKLGCAGHALFATKDGTVPCRGSLIMSSGISVKIPFGHYGKIEAVPYLGMRYDITPFGNIIDEKNGEIIYIKLLNNSNANYTVKKGDNIAQLIIQRYTTPFIRYNGQQGQQRDGFGPIGTNVYK